VELGKPPCNSEQQVTRLRAGQTVCGASHGGNALSEIKVSFTGAERAQRAEWAERTQRAERAQRLQRAEQAERAQRAERAHVLSGQSYGAPLSAQPFLTKRPCMCHGEEAVVHQVKDRTKVVTRPKFSIFLTFACPKFLFPLT